MPRREQSIFLFLFFFFLENVIFKYQFITKEEKKTGKKVYFSKAEGWKVIVKNREEEGGSGRGGSNKKNQDMANFFNSTTIDRI